MEVDPAYFASQLIETYVVETLKTGASDRPHTVIGYEEMLFPAHEDVFPLKHIRNMHYASTGLLLERPKSSEFSPVTEIVLVCSAPSFICSEEVVFRTDDLSFEIGGERWVVFRQALYSQVSAQEGLSWIHVLDLDLNLVLLLLGLLHSLEFAARAQERTYTGRLRT